MHVPTRDQAEEFLAQYCSEIPVWDGARLLAYEYEVWLPHVVARFCREEELKNPGYSEHPQQWPLWQAFYDAAWELCRRGILRPGSLIPHGRGSSEPRFGDGYSLTIRGREWLKEFQSRWYPTDPGRFVSSLSRTSALCGDAFTQRAHEAARCQESRLSFACCAMCGAAAESILVALATAKLGDPDEVFKIYTVKDGRKRLLDKVAEGLDGFLRRGLEPGFAVLAYWRDSAAHGKAETITEIEAEAALLTLYRFSMFVVDNWTALTGKPTD